MDAAARGLVEAATVRLNRRGEDRTIAATGQGVLVAGRMVVTAAHCVNWSERGLMALGEPFLEEIETPDGRRFMLEIVAVEPVADVALLAAVDDQSLPDDFDAFEEWEELTQPVGLSLWEPPMQQILVDDPGRPRLSEPSAIAVHVRTHLNGWIEGRAIRFGFGEQRSPKVALRTTEMVPSGTSGGPVVDDAGRLLGVVSSGEKVPVVHRALPAWARSRILDAEGDR